MATLSEAPEDTLPSGSMKHAGYVIQARLMAEEQDLLAQAAHGAQLFIEDPRGGTQLGIERPPHMRSGQNSLM